MASSKSMNELTLAPQAVAGGREGNYRPMIMSWVGTVSGRPWAGDLMLLADGTHTGLGLRLALSGTCTAYWSPSKSALKAVQTSGCSLMALPRPAPAQGLDAQTVAGVGRFSSTGCSVMTSFQQSNT